jgi:hypothetical protein
MSAGAASSFLLAESEMPLTPSPRDNAKRLRRAQLVGAAVVVAALAIGGVALRDAFTRPSMSEVAVAAVRPTTIPATAAAGRTVDGVHFPNWTLWGWAVAGGRVDHVEDGRTISTNTYARGEQRVAVAIVSGTGWVDDNTMWGSSTFVRRGTHQVELRQWSGTVNSGGAEPVVAGITVLRRQVADHTVVLTG